MPSLLRVIAGFVIVAALAVMPACSEPPAAEVTNTVGIPSNDPLPGSAAPREGGALRDIDEWTAFPLLLTPVGLEGSGADCDPVLDPYSACI